MLHRFETAQAMSDYQAEREVQEALRVQGMAPAARSQWLQEDCGRLQDTATLLSTIEEPMPQAARSYATMIEKSRFDEARELRQALLMPIHRQVACSS